MTASRGPVGCVTPPHPLLQAYTYWNWYNYLERRAASLGRRVLRINCDESPVCVYQGSGRGNVFPVQSRATKRKPHQNVPKGLQRTYVTLLAFVCDMTDGR